MDPKIQKYFKNVPQEELQKYLNFQAYNKPKQVNLNGKEWSYYQAGEGKETILLLGGGINFEIVWFPYIEALRNDYTIIVPIYPVVGNLEELLFGIKGILNNENITEVHIIGQSFGGMVAQSFGKKYPAMTHKLIIVNSATASTAIPEKIRQKKIKTTRSIVKKMRFYPLKLMSYFLANSTYLSYFTKKYRNNFHLWRGILIEIFKTKITKPLYSSTITCMADFYETQNFTQEDFGKNDILIIESENDSAMKPDERQHLKAVYPSAKVITFEDAGHVALIIKEQACLEAIRMFIKG